VAVLTALLIFGVAGFAVTAGVRYAVGWITGNETGTERLVGTAATESEGLRMAVTSVQDTAHFMRVDATVSNQTGNTISLPLGFCSLIGGGGTALRADDFRSDWPNSFGDGTRIKGTVIFGGHLGDGARHADLSCDSVFAQGFGGPRSIRVRMDLKPG